MKGLSAAAAALAVVLALAAGSEAHKGATSKFTFNDDVYPIFMSRCGRCHVDGGVGPMSLLKYEDAFPWAESLRSELLAAYPEAASGADAPKVDSHDFVKAAHRQIVARELDVVLEWATGGTPEGDPAKAPAPAAVKNDWSGGKPGLIAAIPSPFKMAPNDTESTQEFIIPLAVSLPRNASQLDLLPGNPAIVRSAAILLRGPDGSTRPLGTWFPRQSPQPIAIKPPARIEPNSQLVARIHYKKTWKFEGQAMTDRSTVGLYFTD